MRAVADHRLPHRFILLSGAALLANPLWYLAPAGIADATPSLIYLGLLVATVGVPALAAWTLTLDRPGGWPVGYAVASAGQSFALMLLGLLSFGPLFVPSFALWLAAAVVGVRAQRPPVLAVATAALSGMGLLIVLSALTSAIGWLWTRI